MCADSITIHFLDQVERTCSVRLDVKLKVEPQEKRGESPPRREKRRHDVSVRVGILVCAKATSWMCSKRGGGAVAEWVGTMGVFAESMTAILA